MSKDTFLEVKNVCKQFGGVQVLKSIDFDVKVGEVHCLIGPNGCGKSTLIKIISGVYQPDPGAEIYILGKPIKNNSSAQSMNRQIQVIYQDLSVFPTLTVAENIAYFSYFQKGKKKGVYWKEIRALAQRVLDKIKIQLPLDMLVEDLSIAERQIVAIARSLATDAKLIIMDEPTSSLTRDEVAVLFGIIRELTASGISIMFVSHKLDEIIDVADRITAIRDGVKIGTSLVSETNQDKLMEMISGQEIKFPSPARVSENAKTILKVEDLSRTREYESISFELREGEILGLYGPLGSGRTEIALSLFGMTKPNAGKIYLGDKAVNFRVNKDAIDAGIAYLPEDRLRQGLVLESKVKTNIAVTVFDRLVNKLSIINKKAVDILADTWVDRLMIKTAGINAHARTLSGGNQQKVVLGKWLSIAPKVLILDEPTNGVDIISKSAIYEIIREQARTGVATLLISSEVAEIYHNCARVLIMNKGRIVNEIYTDEVSEEDFAEYVR